MQSHQETGIEKFFKEALEMVGGETFVKSLREFLSENSIEKNNNDLCDEIYSLRINNDFLKILYTNWQLAELFLDAITEHADPDKKNLILNSSFKHIYYFNHLRRTIIPLGVRLNMPILFQQNHVLQVMRREIANKRKPVDMPVMPTPGVRTQRIEQLAEEGEIIIPDSLICSISLQLLVDPVKVIQENHTFYFEKQFIERTIQLTGKNPLNNLALKIEDLSEAPDKKQELEEYKQKMWRQINSMIEEDAPIKEDNLTNISPKSDNRVSNIISPEREASAPEVENVAEDSVLIDFVNTQIVNSLQVELNRLNKKASNTSKNNKDYDKRIEIFTEVIDSIKQLTTTYQQNKNQEGYKNDVISKLESFKDNPNIVKYKPYEKSLLKLLNFAILILTGVVPGLIKYTASGSLFFSVEGKSKDTAETAFKKMKHRK